MALGATVIVGYVRFHLNQEASSQIPLISTMLAVTPPPNPLVSIETTCLRQNETLTSGPMDVSAEVAVLAGWRSGHER